MSRILILMCIVIASTTFAEELRIVVGEEERADLSLTIYNNNFALIRERKNIVLPRGRFELEYQDVARSIDPSSVQVTSNKDGLEVLEQSYLYDLLNKRTLLEKFLGRKLKYSRSVLDGKRYEKVLREGTLLSINPEVVLFGDEIEIAPEGTISLAYFPDDLKARPTLLWLMENKRQGDQVLEVSYLADNLIWRTDYVLTLNQKGTKADLLGTVTVENRSGADYHDAQLKLVAGNVQRIQKRPRAGMRARAVPQLEEVVVTAQRGSDSVRTPFFDYHLYQYPRRVTFEANSKKRLKLFEGKNIPVKKSYSFTFGVAQYQEPESPKISADVQLSFINNRKNHLDVPLPAGPIRNYKKDDDGLLLFIGEDSIPHTPEGSDIELVIGHAFDITAKRTQTSYRVLNDAGGRRGVEVSYSITVKNQKKERIEVSLKGKLQGDWTIEQQSHKGRRVDSTTQLYVLQMDGGAEETVNYTVRFKY